MDLHQGPSEKGFVVVRLSYELSKHVPHQHEHGMLLLVKLQAIETSFKERYIIRGDEIGRGGV